MPWPRMKCGDPQEAGGDDGCGGCGGPVYRTCLLSSSPAPFEDVMPLMSQNKASASKRSDRIARTTRFTYILEQGWFAGRARKYASRVTSFDASTVFIAQPVTLLIGPT